jgi:divalent metal cation (Fe/Co/Zn/Cd) transporter
LRDARRAKLLSWASLAYMTLEGGVAITAAVITGSVALLGFGIDSAIEGLASVIIVWRFTGSRTLSENAERRAQRLVAATFFLLAPYIAFEAIQALVTGEHADTETTAGWIGMGLTASSAVVMPWLGIAKQRIGTRINSVATAGEGMQNLLCAYLAGAVLLGLLANTLFGAWWLDPLIALAIAAVAGREGKEAWEGSDVCC